MLQRPLGTGTGKLLATVPRRTAPWYEITRITPFRSNTRRPLGTGAGKLLAFVPRRTGSWYFLARLFLFSYHAPSSHGTKTQVLFPPVPKTTRLRSSRVEISTFNSISGNTGLTETTNKPTRAKPTLPYRIWNSSSARRKRSPTSRRTSLPAGIFSPLT